MKNKEIVETSGTTFERRMKTIHDTSEEEDEID